MADIEPLVFNGVTPEQYARLVNRAKAAGIDIIGNNGTVQKYGAGIAYDYAPSTEVLKLECTKTPFFMKPGDVYARLRALVVET